MADRTFYYYRTPSGREILVCQVSCTLQYAEQHACRHCCNSPSSCGLADREFDDFTQVSEVEFDTMLDNIDEMKHMMVVEAII